MNLKKSIGTELLLQLSIRVGKVDVCLLANKSFSNG